LNILLLQAVDQVAEVNRAVAELGDYYQDQLVLG
jgi:hypothetical protein